MDRRLQRDYLTTALGCGGSIVITRNHGDHGPEELRMDHGSWMLFHANAGELGDLGFGTPPGIMLVRDPPTLHASIICGGIAAATWTPSSKETFEEWLIVQVAMGNLVAFA